MNDEFEGGGSLWDIPSFPALHLEVLKKSREVNKIAFPR
jgi:hypothetical protein